MKEKLSPRQRLINMMYLVLLALLALNIQVDFIDAFFDLSSSIERTVKKIDIEKEQRIQSISSAYALDSVTYADTYEKSIITEKIADNATDFIDSLRAYLIKRTGGFNEYGYPVNSIDPRISDNVFIQRRGARRLKELLQLSKHNFIQLLPLDKRYLLQDIYEASDYITNSRGISLSWEEYHFNNLALGGSLALLSRFKNDIKIMESVILSYYLNEIYGELTTFIISSNQDSLNIEMGVVNPETFKIGDDIKIKIQLPKFQEINKTNIVLLDKDNIEVKEVKADNDKNEVALKAIRPGKYKVKADVLNIENKVVNSIEKEFEILDINPDKVRYIVIDELIKSSFHNVLYLGVKNRIEVKHPNFNTSELLLKTNNGRLKRKVDYYTLLPERAGHTVLALYHKGAKVAERIFVVKTLPEPKPLLSNSVNNTISKKLFKIQTALSVEVSGFEFPEAYQIQNFTMLRLNAEGEQVFKAVNKTAFFSGKTLHQVRSASINETFIFTDILVKSSDGISRNISSLVLKIK